MTTDNPGRRDLLLAGSTAMLAGTLASLGVAAQTPVPTKALRILLLNPNSSPDFTRIIAAEARRVGSPDTEFVEATSPFGPRYIGSRATVVIAGHAAVDGLARILATGEPFNAAILAGFGAQGGPALREIAPFPVVDMLTASTSAAILLGNRFSILTGGDRWVPMLKEQLAALGLGDRVASVRAIPLMGAEITQDPDRAVTLLADLAQTCVREDGAECVILGGAAVAGLHRRMADQVSVPLLDSVAISVATAEMLARVATTPTASRARPPAIDSVGLSEELSTLLKRP